MLNWIIDFSLRHRLLVILGVAIFAVLGGAALRKLDIDAFPDTTPVQVQINTVAASLGPEEVEQRITFPIEQAIGGLPGLEGMRSVSKFGFSQVVVTFKDGTDIYFARQLVNERLSTVELSNEIERPKMGPVYSACSYATFRNWSPIRLSTARVHILSSGLPTAGCCCLPRRANCAVLR